MALYVGLRRARRFAGIIGYSGRLVAAHLLAEELLSRPPVLLVHGTDDTRVSFPSMIEDGDGAAGGRRSGQDTGCVGTEHSIDQEGLLRGGRFLQQLLSTPGH